MGGMKARLRRAAKRRVRRIRNRFDRRPIAHFIHIPKTAGTALRVPLVQHHRSTTYRLLLHTHGWHLDDVPEGDKFFFCVRDPIDRYVSGFLYTQRQGQPRFTAPWSEAEAVAFSRFDSPECLAIALGAGGDWQRAAEDAMRTIGHVNTSYWDWFGDPAYFKRRSNDLLWIGRQESLDLEGLAEALGVARLTMPEDTNAANRSPHLRPELSDLGRENLTRWYARDYQFLELCDEVFPLA